MQYTRIVLNEPHASIEGLYDEHLSFWNIDEKFVNDIVLITTKTGLGTISVQHCVT